MSFGGLMNQVPEIPANDVVGLDDFVDAKTEALYNRIMNEIGGRGYLPVRQKEFTSWQTGGSFNIVQRNDVIDFSMVSLSFFNLKLKNPSNKQDIKVEGDINTGIIPVLNYVIKTDPLIVPRVTFNIQCAQYQINEGYAYGSHLYFYSNGSNVEIDTVNGKADSNLKCSYTANISFDKCVATYYP